ncbi:MAG: hypothetical protein ACFFDF_02540 [Candidatus Odinarchaeota archaeon]
MFNYNVFNSQSYEAKCPICGGMLTEIKGYSIGLAKLVCPKCKYEKMK